MLDDLSHEPALATDGLGHRVGVGPVTPHPVCQLTVKGLYRLRPVPA